MTNKANNIFIIAGEISGDHHAAALINDVKRLAPETRFEGIGSDKMKAAGARIDYDCRAIAVVGLAEVIKILPRIYKLFRYVKHKFENDPPDLVVLVDYPGFNLKVAKLAKRYGIPVLYYISPQIWAWRQKRIHTIKRCVDQMAVILPFETEIYQQAGVPVQFVGNPTTEAVKPAMPPERAREYFNIDPEKQIVALAPGSRRNEIQRMLPVYLQTAEELQSRVPNLHFILTLAPGVDREAIESQINQYPNLSIQLIDNQRFEALQLAKAAVVTSGTATLETALLGVPLVLAYKVSWPTYWFGRMVIKAPYIGLCNLVAQQRIAPELIQSEANPGNIADYLTQLLTDSDFYNSQLSQYRTLQSRLPGVSEKNRIAPLVIETAKRNT